MVRNMNRIGIGVVSAVLMATAVSGCGTQNNNPDNIAGAPTTAVKSATSTPSVDTTTSVPPVNTAPDAGASSTASTGAFDAAANTWSQVEAARAELDTAIKAKKLDQVHAAATKISDLVKTLPDESATLPEDKRKTLDAHVKNVGELTAMMDKSADPNDMKSTEEHQTAMNDALEMMKGMYPAGTMHSSMHMPNMNSSGKGMSGMGDKMGKMGGMGEKMRDKMGGMGKPTDPAKPADPNAKPMPGGDM